MLSVVYVVRSHEDVTARRRTTGTGTQPDHVQGERPKLHDEEGELGLFLRLNVLS
jgi:hypothetical protein